MCGSVVDMARILPVALTAYRQHIEEALTQGATITYPTAHTVAWATLHHKGGYSCDVPIEAIPDSYWEAEE